MAQKNITYIMNLLKLLMYLIQALIMDEFISKLNLEPPNNKIYKVIICDI